MTQPRALAACVAATFAVALGAGAAVAEAQPNPQVAETVERLTFGVYCADAPADVEEAPDTAAGVVNIVPRLPEFRATTTLVPAELGSGFGVRVLMAPGVSMDPVQVTITHPPYPDSGIEVERWITAFDDQDESLVGFSFEVPAELVPGPWTFEAQYEGERVFHIAFEVVPPALLPELRGMCAGNFMS